MGGSIFYTCTGSIWDRPARLCKLLRKESAKNAKLNAAIKSSKIMNLIGIPFIYLILT